MLHRLIPVGFALILPVAALASALDERHLSTEPVGPVILTVSGNIEGVGSSPVVRLDRAMLEALGTTTLKTTTVWTSGEVVFEGVLVRDVLQALGAQGREVVATALNDYVATLPLQELYQYPVMLAFKMNGAYLQIKDKGPLWLVYPRDQFPELRNSMTDKKWVWQLRDLEVR
jgi:hypothetical protein